MKGIKKNTTINSSISSKPIMQPQLKLYQLAGRNLNFIRIAGLSGASAVLLGAIGAHKEFPNVDNTDLKKVFETANRFHFFHSLALLAVPLARRPIIVSSDSATKYESPNTKFIYY